MKNKSFILVLLMVLFIPLITFADDLTPAQQTFRSSILAFLKEEGFAPYIDADDNSITFKKEGQFYWIVVLEESPFFVILNRGGYSFEGENAIDRTSALIASNAVNRDKEAVKLYCNDKSVKICVESFTRSVEDFKYVFFRSIRALDRAKEQFNSEYKNLLKQSDSPIKITNVLVGNTNQDGSIISDYGSAIYSYKTKYLKPQITVNSDASGTYRIDVKMYAPSGLSTSTNSPSGYSFYSDVTLTKGMNSVTASGWGSNTSGHWKTGSYSYEFYYQGQKLYTKYFEIK